VALTQVQVLPQLLVQLHLLLGSQLAPQVPPVSATVAASIPGPTLSSGSVVDINQFLCQLANYDAPVMSLSTGVISDCLPVTWAEYSPFPAQPLHSYSSLYVLAFFPHRDRRAKELTTKSKSIIQSTSFPLWIPRSTGKTYLANTLLLKVLSKGANTLLKVLSKGAKFGMLPPREIIQPCLNLPLTLQLWSGP
jgi:hypothetical protein